MERFHLLTGCSRRYFYIFFLKRRASIWLIIIHFHRDQIPVKAKSTFISMNRDLMDLSGDSCLSEVSLT